MPIDIGAEGEWLRELCNVVSPEFWRQLEEAEVERLAEQHQHSDGEEPTKTLPHTDTNAPKGAYSNMLALLREGRGWKRQMARHLCSMHDPASSRPRGVDHREMSSARRNGRQRHYFPGMRSPPDHLRWLTRNSGDDWAAAMKMTVHSCPSRIRSFPS